MSSVLATRPFLDLRKPTTIFTKLKDLDSYNHASWKYGRSIELMMFSGSPFWEIYEHEKNQLRGFLWFIRAFFPIFS